LGGHESHGGRDDLDTLQVLQLRTTESVRDRQIGCEDMGADFKSYPRGRLNAQDEGAIEVGVTVQQDVVVIAFPKPCAWVGMPAEQAEELAAMLLARAKDARRNRQ
jgi:hypothetical protein